MMQEKSFVSLLDSENAEKTLLAVLCGLRGRPCNAGMSSGRFARGDRRPAGTNAPEQKSRQQFSMELEAVAAGTQTFEFASRWLLTDWSSLPRRQSLTAAVVLEHLDPPR